MSVPNKQMLLLKLPPYQDEWIMVKEKQKVDDIVVHVLKVHKKYAPYYDKIALYFDAPTIKGICDKLYTFCKKNIAYVEEPEEAQTNGLPTGFLERGFGDCKHNATFCGGILDALNRLTDKNIEWCYRFASYNILVRKPHHVFVVVYDEQGNEIWIDPVPGADKKDPDWILDKTVKASSMPLYENIAGVNDPGVRYYATRGNNSIGTASLVLTPRININPLNWNYSNSYPGVFDPYLGISQYRDEGGDRNLNKDEIATQLNALIAQGPNPGHTVSPDFVEWVYNANIRSWNFYYPDGVKPGFTAQDLLPANYPRLIITDDGRLTLNSDQALDDYKNPEIHLLTAWAQELINEFDPSPYPVKPEHIKIHSQMKEGNVDTRNLFTEARGDSIFHEVGKALEGALNFAKAGFVKIVGSIPRNAFLGLVGVNAFGMATGLQRHIDAGQWESIASHWRKLGGNPDKLLNTINDGKVKKAILGNTATIGEPITVSTLLVSAAPIIAIMLKFLDKDGKITEVLSATKGFLATAYPGIDLSDYGFLDKNTGKELDFYVDPIDDENLGGGNNNLPAPPSGDPMTWLKNNPLPAAALVGAGTFLITKKKGQKPNFIIPLIAAGATYFLLNKNGSASTTTSKREALIKWANAAGDNSADTASTIEIFKMMDENEINNTYDFIFNHVIKNIPVQQGSPLYNAIAIISQKYQIFT